MYNKRLLFFYFSFLPVILLACLPVKAQFLSKFGILGSGDGQIKNPFDVAVDKQGNIFVVDHGNTRIHKFNSSGQSLLRFGSFGTADGQFMSVQGIALDEQGNVYVADYNTENIQKFDSNGKFLFKFGVHGTADGQFYLPNRVTVDAQGNIYVTDHGNHRVQKFDATGKFLLKIGTGTSGTADGQFQNTHGVAVDAEGNMYVVDLFNHRIQKFNARGQFLLKFGGYGTGDGQFNYPHDIDIDAQGNIYVVERYNHRIQKFNANGQFLSKFGSLGAGDGQFSDPSGIAFDQYNNLYVADIQNHRIQKFKVVSAPNYIKGTIYNDVDGNCVKNSGEKGIAGVVVAVQPGNYYASADSSGNYSIAVDTGSYTVQQIIPDDKTDFIKQLCPVNPAVYPVRFARYNDSVVGKNFANQLSLRHHLSIKVSSDRRRRCMTNFTTVSYCNSGIERAPDAKVYVKLPEYVVLKSASLAYTRDRDSNYVFSVGTLAADACGRIEMQDSVVCNDPDIRGLTQCTTAWITPANSRTPSSSWDQSDINLKAKCVENGRVRLGMYNTGRASMADSSEFRIYLDAQLAFTRRFKLAKGDSLVLQVPANGQTVRLEVDQRSYHPSRKQSHITIEACGRNGKGSVSKGYVCQQPQEEEEPEISTECLPIVDSFDPNDKAVSPQGVGNEHYTPTNKALDYVIRFQNTGTDVAYKVVVVDTLSDHLDIGTLQVGAVSHAYQMNVSGKGRPVLTFTFRNINLPDSTTDQAGSNGFIQFSIKPKANLSLKARIENAADIYFDYNEPVRTNTTLNTIYDIPVVVTAPARLDQSVVCTNADTPVNAGKSRVACEQDTVRLQATAAQYGQGSWKRIGGTGVVREMHNPASLITGLSYGENVFEWSVPANTCGTDSLRARISIARLRKPAAPVIAQRGADSLLCSTAADTYEWYLEGNLLSVNTRLIKAGPAGNYTVKAINQADCPSDLSAAFAYVPTSTQNRLASQVTLYPNPTTGKVVLRLPASLGPRADIQLFDAIGRSIMNQAVQLISSPEHEVELDLSAYPAGLFTMKLQTSKGTITKRIIRTAGR